MENTEEIEGTSRGKVCQGLEIRTAGAAAGEVDQEEVEVLGEQQRLSKTGSNFEEPTKVHLAAYGDAGLRTMALAYRKLDEAAYQQWNEVFLEAKNTIAASRDAKLDAVSEMIEKDLILVGATAVEDKLQKGVPECIDKLALAGLKIWVLTGDKMETAINIGFACSLLRQDMKQILITLDTPNVKSVEDLNDKDAITKISNETILNQLTLGQQHVSFETGFDTAFALIIDGKALAYALEDGMKEKFLQLAVKCASVLCCRVSPKQKAMVVMASDFSIAQFCFLDRLLIVHGHWCYKRIATMVCYFFYKNIAFGMTMFYYQGYTSFSGQTLYNDWFQTLFNAVFTALPVCVLGISEQDVPAKVFLEFPNVYQQGPKNMFFTWARILAWMSNGVLAGIFGPYAFRQGGQVPELEVLGAAMYTAMVWLLNCQIVLAATYLTSMLHRHIWGTIAMWYLFLLIYGFMSPTTSTTAYRVLIEALAPSPSYWIATLLVAIACLVPYFAFTVFQRRFRPMDHHILQEIMYLNKHMDDPEMWSKERRKAIVKATFGFTSRVEAKIRRLREKMHGGSSPPRNDTLVCLPGVLSRWQHGEEECGLCSSSAPMHSFNSSIAMVAARRRFKPKVGKMGM